MSLFEFYKSSNKISRSISMENVSGQKSEGGKAIDGANKPFLGELGQGYKVSPCVFINANEEYEIAKINEEGIIKHIWMTLDINHSLKMNLRVYYDGNDFPSIDVPLTKFFFVGFDQRTEVNSLLISVNPGFGLNSYFPMPFKKSIRMTVTNNNPFPAVLYFQIDYELGKNDDNAMYLHCLYNESFPVKKYDNHIILPTIKGKGSYVGTFLTYETDFTTWWGEGELKFFIDGDDKFPTICGTGTEDYFGGAWNFELPPGTYKKFSTPYLGLTEIIPEGKINIKNQKFAMYRLHVQDPIYFNDDLRVEIQSIGWSEDYKLYRLNEANITSLCYFYLETPINLERRK